MPGGGVSLTSVEVKWASMGGINVMLFWNPKEPLQLPLDQNNIPMSLAQHVGNNMGLIYAMLRELVNLRERLCALEEVDPPPLVDSAKELGPPPSTAAKKLLLSE